MLAVLLAALLTACTGAAPAPRGDAPPVHGVDATACADRACLQREDGRLVRVEGTLVVPPAPKLPRRLRLDDGTELALARPQADAAGGISGLEAGRRLRLLGRPFLGEIPASYGVIGRTDDPWLLDLSMIEVLPASSGR